ncbi:hypothetical protein CROQUDRAFT_104812 [Cronartium quercuum f. sp. fusiforme G11]|uniref:Nucleoside transporter n=1 Tax=Cronartium quercuum f. sp. fusiforme G11 TaxID=708437 RepID=A0A9P6TFF8_9BASI|nr:hypothetical protein CROQUDRAFT_104812 [Cronartium quercuum f. sp. fusiforme G11]
MTAGENRLIFESETNQNITKFQKTTSYFCFFVLGASILLPWNSLLVSSNYFGSRLKGSQFEFTYINWLTLVFTFFNVSFITKATFNQDSRPTRTILLSLTSIVLLSMTLLISTKIEDLKAKTFFSFLIIITFLEAISSAYLQNSVIAISSWFGPSCLQAILSGQGAIGAIVSLLQLLSSLREFKVDEETNSMISSIPVRTNQDKIRNSSYTFYLTVTIFTIFALLCFFTLSNLPFYKFVIKFNKKADNDEGQLISENDDALSRAPLLRQSLEADLTTTLLKPTNLRLVERKIRSLGLGVFYVFFITLSVFPSITGSIISSSSNSSLKGNSNLWDNWTNPLIFIPIHFVCFNFGDWFGRVLPLLLPTISNLLISNHKTLINLSFSRTCFIPLFLLCNVQNNSLVIFNSDLIYFIFLSTFSITNGYFSTLLMIAGVTHSKLEPREVDIAATCMSLYLTFGLAMGSFVSFAVKALTKLL